MQQVKHTIITDWLYQYGDSKIDKKVQKYLETKKRTMEQVKQTAVEWLVDEINKLIGLNICKDEPIIEQAKEIEKEQIINAYLKSKRKRTDLLGALKIMDEAEQYYNETFKSE
jgi:transcription initiation factor IIF auxiliary subunit